MLQQVIVIRLLRFFDKDEDGKLSGEELREIMVKIGDHPVSEEEFQDFLTVLFWGTICRYEKGSKEYLKFLKNVSILFFILEPF